MLALEPLGKIAIEIIPLKPFKSWLSLVQANLGESLFSDYKNEKPNNSLYMIPAEYLGYLDKFLKDHYDLIFTNELGAWVIEEGLWPQNRNLQMFSLWFEIKTFGFCWDLDEEEDEMPLWNPN